MTLPATIKVLINFSNGASLGNALILGSPTYPLGIGELASVAPFIVDVTSTVASISTRRNRNLIQQQFEAGSATIRLYDVNGDFNPQNTSSPYFGYLQPLRKISVTATYSAVSYNIFAGYITDYLYTYPTSQDIGYVDLICTDAFKLFYNTTITTISGAAGQNTGERITAILNAAGFPSSLRSIATGNTICQADTGTTRPVLDAIRTVEFTEQGAFYIDGGGKAVFKNRQFCYDAQSALPTIFNQSGTGINYAGITFAFDDKTIINEADITCIGGTKQSYSDAASVTSYFAHTITRTDLLMTTDAEALNLATAYVVTRKDTTIRIDSISLDLVTLGYGAGIIAALDLDYFDTVQVSNDQAGGSTIVKKLQVLGINHDITPNSWVTTFNTQEPIIDVMY